MPQVETVRRFLGDSETGRATAPLPQYEPIELPRNTPTGFIVAFFTVTLKLRCDLAYLVDGDHRAACRRSGRDGRLA